MPRNIEIKAILVEPAKTRRLVEQLATAGPTLLHQDDTFFNTPTGRLKLRVFADGSGELIFYQRPDQTGPATSDYLIVPVPDPDGMRLLLERSMGTAGRVRKRRTLYLIGRTRVHLDEVESLGNFLELEVVLSDDESGESGLNEANRLLQELQIASDTLIDTAYVDLLNGKSRSNTR
ncbi:MAG: class IV adenylate cyclase [Bacteroidetes bacterium]|nr:class IV adenylate cyclase [Bacteroidota bacterium]